jgi:hypothetical protein
MLTILLSCRQDTSKICNECEEFSLPSFPNYSPLGSSANFAANNPGNLSINISVSSFVNNRTELTKNMVIEEIQHAVQYWNQANFGLMLSVGDTGKDCCVTDQDSACTDCAVDTASDVFFRDEDNRTAQAAGTKPVQNVEFCPIAMDVIFYSGSISENGDRCELTWVQKNVSNEECKDDWTAEKPFHQTLVHEIGHVVGLYHPDEGDSGIWKQSVMYELEDGCVGCNHENVQFPDDQAVIEMYQECN